MSFESRAHFSKNNNEWKGTGFFDRKGFSNHGEKSWFSNKTTINAGNPSLSCKDEKEFEKLEKK